VVVSGEEERKEGKEGKHVIFVASASGGGGGRSSDWEDVEVLRGVLKAVSDFLKDIREPLKGLMDFALGSIDGERVGSDVARFYQKLREAGVPEDLAAQLTRDYFKARMESVNLPNLMREFMERFGGRLGIRPHGQGEEEDEDEE
jgi:hypothetical protein